MTDIEQFKDLLEGNTRKLTEDLIDHKKEHSANERWSGVVIDNNDPSRLGRCQIRVMGFYDDVADKFLPWAIPDIGYIGSSKGSFVIPEIGTRVRGYFDKGDVQKPIYDSVAFNEDNADSEYSSRNDAADYPHKMVLLETDKGDYLTLNRNNGELVFIHRSGAMVRIDEKGNMKIATGVISNSDGHMSIEVNGDTELITKGNTTIQSDGNVEVKAVRGQINLGNNPAKQLVNNLPTCPVIGCPLAVGNTQVFA